MLERGTKAPAFALESTAGESYRLDEGLSQGPVLLVFFKTTCGTCNLAFPYFNKLRQSYPQENWQVWAVSQDNLEASKRYSERIGFSFPALLDGTDWPVSRAYDPVATPTYYLVDRDGVIVDVNSGFSKDGLNDLSALIAERLGAETQVIAPPDDGNPPFRPG